MFWHQLEAFLLIQIRVHLWLRLNFLNGFIPMRNTIASCDLGRFIRPVPGRERLRIEVFGA